MPPFQNARATGFAAALFCAVISPSVLAGPVISEIMYRPGTGYPENTALEYIELHNPDAAAVDISGWEFHKGVNYLFPAGTVIPAGGYLVVASDPTALQAVHGALNAVGPWQAGNSLSNNGETVTLSMPGVAPGTRTKVDEVIYASEGDWAQRVRDGFGGWDWTTPANEDGQSLELRNPALSNDNGQNWAPSTSGAGGTPGAANSVATTNVPPIIHAVKHSPAMPTTTQSVTISCEVNDEAPAADRAATLFYRNATSASPPAFSSVAMTNDGTGKFRAVLPPSPVDKTIVEFYISSSDGSAARTWPAATSEGQNANCQFQVDNEVPSTTAETCRLTLTAAENSSFTSLAGSNPGSDRQFNLTLIVQRGTETSIRYRSAMRIRGNSSRSYQFKPLRLSIPNDDPLDAVTRFNLNPRSSYLQYLGMKCFQAAGLPASDVVPVELRRNGSEQTTSSGTTPDYGRWVRMEELGGEMVDNHWPEANSGNIYKKGRPDQYWRSTASAPSDPDNLLDGWSKQNNSSNNDWSDLTGFFTAIQSISEPHFPGSSPGNSAGANGGALSGVGNWAGTAYDGDQMEQLDNVADTAQWARWFAMMTLLQSNETNISNGQDDDYSCYFVPASGGRRRMLLLPHDLDTILGLGDNTGTRGLYDATSDGSVFRPLLPLMGNNTTPGNDAWRASYHTAVRQFCGTVFDPATFPAFVEYHLGTWVPANVRTSISSFMETRCTALLGTIGSGPLTPPAPTASSTLVQAHGSLILSEVLAANAAAHLHDDGYPDVIEIQNTGATTMDLGGKSLTDDPIVPQKFVFAGGTQLTAGSFLVLYGDSNFAGSGLHTGFALDQSGDTVYLYDSPANDGGLLDSFTFGPQATDFSVGRTGAGLNTLTICTPTIGAANTALTTLGAPGSLRINEWFTNPDFRLNDDFVEIYNGGATPVPMGGMRLTDDFINYPSKHTLPVLSYIGPGGFHVFKAKGNDATSGNPSELPFSFDSTFGGVALLGTNGSLADRVETVSQFRDQSTGRSPDGDVAFVTFAVPSPGLPNTSPPAGYQALLNSLRISEFIYRPNGGNDYEFIELQNTGAVSLNLSGVRFTNGVDYTFPAGVSLAPGAFIVVCRNRTAFLQRFPNALSVLAPDQYTGALDNNGESLTLSLPNPWDVAILNFRYETDWEPLTAGAGYSLTVVDTAVVPARDYNERESWTASVVPDGTPGSDGPPGINSPLTAAGIVGDAFSYTITASRSPGSFSASPLPAGLTVNTSSGLISGTPVAAGVFNVTLTAANTTGTDTETLVVSISSSGPLHHFSWDYTPPGAEAGVPFPAVISARDSVDRLVTSFSGPVPVSAAAVSGGSSASSVYIMEITDEGEDQFELQNTGTVPVNTTGWYAVAGNSAAIDSPNSITWTLPNSVAPGEILRVSELNGQPGRLWYGASIAWTVALNRGWIMLFDAGGVMRDFFAWGWTSEELEAVTINVNGSPVTLAGHWSGAGTPVGTRSNNNNSWQRTGPGDTNTAADWVFATNATSWGLTNTGLTLPWAGSVTVTITPPTATFTGGVFAGFFTAAETAEGVRLSVSDAQSHTGQSTPFDIIAPAADTDGDKLPDAWENANGLNPSAAADAAADADGDGYTNRVEYYAGTDPRSAASRLAITEWSASPPSQVSLSWNAQAGRLYRIRWSTGLSTWDYVPGLAVISPAAGTQTAVFAPPPGTGSRAFYQLELLTPP
jgi:hypothetical protein